MAQLQIRESSIPPFPHINPQPLLPTPSPLSSIHPREQPALQVMPAHLGASAEVHKSPDPCLPPPQVPEGSSGTTAGAESLLMEHKQVAASTSTAQNQSTALAPRDGFIQRTKGLKMSQRSQPDGKALHAQPAEMLAGPPEPARRCTPQRAALLLPPPAPCRCAAAPAWLSALHALLLRLASPQGTFCFLWDGSSGCLRSCWQAHAGVPLPGLGAG